LKEIIREGWKLLKEGASSLEVVTKIVVLLENSESFNAGYGAALNSEGQVELDASIMDGNRGKFGGVTGITVIQNPIIVARAVLESPYVLFQGNGANELARRVAAKKGLKIAPNNDFVTEHRLNQLNRWRKDHKNNPIKLISGGTVGAVVFDGISITAGTSTGGMTGKPPGELGIHQFPGRVHGQIKKAAQALREKVKNLCYMQLPDALFK
jgi:beta-aspartyl-peptidase (threonine type)